MQWTAELNSTILLHPEPIVHRVPRQRCFCHRKSDGKMCLCESCDEWYHLDCVGMTEQQAKAAVDWKCGYCRSDPDEKGNREWNLGIPQGAHKRKRVAKPRNDANSPKAKGVPTGGSEMVEQGPASWDACVALVVAGRKKIQEAELIYKRKAVKIVNEGGHHVVDQMTLGGVERQGVSHALVADLVAIGEIDEEPMDANMAHDCEGDD